MSDTYYTTAGRKVIDFVVGMLGIPLLAGILAAGIASAGRWGVAVVMLSVVALVTVVAAFLARRRFIAIGMLCALAVPLLAFGACLVAIG